MKRPWNATEPGDRTHADDLGRGNTETPPGRRHRKTAPNDFTQHVKGFHMKKFLITILAALVVGGMVSAQSFPDIPSGHWAGDAVEEIADLGIVIGFPDGTFRGNEAFTRYQSALVISRLLAVIDANMEAELGALRGAMQSMAADMAAQGVRLAAAESAIAAISDTLDVHAGLVGANADGIAANAAAIDANAGRIAANANGVGANAAAIAANAARIDALEAAMADMPAGMDEAVLRDLQNQIASVRVAADTAQAQAADAEARAAGAYDLALQALAGSDAIAADVAALNQVVQLLSQRVDGLSAPAPMPAAPVVDLSGIDRNAGDIANIRDFVILLRRDQVALRDRVTALEASGAATAASVEGLEARVAALEAKPFLEISGEIELDYMVGRTIGTYDFDIDRVYGLNADRDNGASFFSTGAEELTGDDEEDDPDDFETGVAEVAQDRADITAQNGIVNPSITVTVTMDREFTGTGSPRALDSFSAVATFEANASDVVGDESDITFIVTDFETTFEPIGSGAPITFAYGEEVSVEFTNYVFVADDLNGYVATVSAPDFLAFLNPGLTAAYFSDQAGGYWRGIRGTMAPSFGDAITLSGGVSFAQQEDNAADKDDVNGDNATISVWGLDGEIGLLGLVDVAFEYANNTDTTDSVLWVTAAASADLGFLNIESLGGNYRAVDDAFYGIGDTGDSPFERDQTGFGVEGELGLFNLLDIVAFYDNYTSTAPTAESGYGVDVSADLFAGFSLSGFFENALVDGDVAAGTANVREVDAGYELLDGEYDSKFGVELKHDGDADNALISGLNITAGYEANYQTTGYSLTEIYAEADYTLNVAIVTLTPYVGYTMVADGDTPANDYNEIVAGTGIMTSALDIFLQPSLMGAVNYRATNWTDAAYTASELQWSVGLMLGEFLLPNSTLTAKVGQWVGTNTIVATNTNGAGDGATDISEGRDGDFDNGGATETVFGYEVEWNYYDLVFAYGVYDSDRGGNTASAQAFSIAYTVAF